MLRTFVNSLISAPSFKGKVRLLRLGMKLVDGNVLRSRYGVLMRVHHRDFTNFACITGTFQRDYDDVFAEVDALQPGMAFVDIGANGGLFSLVAGKRVGLDGVVLAFEPNLKVFHQLIDHALLNELERFFPFNAAVAAETGVMSFAPGGDDHTGVGRLADDGKGRVAVMAFSDQPLLGHLIGERPTVIKIDVEGAEGLVVRSLAPLLRQPHVVKLIVEIDEANLARNSGMDAASIYQTLGALGFTPRRGLGGARHFNEVFTR